MNVLQIIETAYRATTEEQDDTVLWITRAMNDAGGNLDILLRGNAVNYGVREQDASGLAFGEWQQTQPPQPADDVAGLIASGSDVYYVQEDAADRGIRESELVDGLTPVSRDTIAELLGAYDQVWHW